MSKKKKAEKPLSKKERKALAAREAEIAAELERRKKAAKKSKGGIGKKGAKKLEKAAVEPIVNHAAALGTITIEAEAPIAPESTITEPTATEAMIEHEIQSAESVAERAKPLKGKKLKAALKADTDAAKARKKAEAESDAEIRARVQAKRMAREAASPGSAERLAEMQKDREVNGQIADVRKGKKDLAPTSSDHVLGTREKSTAEKKAEHVAEVVETEHGREIVVGEAPSGEEEFGTVAGAPVLESGRNGYKIIQLGADGKPDPRKVRQVTRVSTFVGNIDDETGIRDWEKRLLAEGLSAAADDYAPRVNELRHRYDVTVAKARKADRKGKLGIGELAGIEERAKKDYKTALNAIVEEALEAAGRHEAAEKGTDLHRLTEIRDADGIEAVRELAEKGEISPTDLASIEAYDERMRRLGAKTLHAEAVVVNDEMGYAGRLDRIVMAKLPEMTIKLADGREVVRPADQRARRYVLDVKTGSLEYGAGKMSRQLAAYALADLYDIETGERTRHSAARDIALLVHLPQGAGACAIYPVDIKIGAALLKLSAEVRRARNTGRKTIDLSVDITDGEPGE